MRQVSLALEILEHKRPAGGKGGERNGRPRRKSRRWRSTIGLQALLLAASGSAVNDGDNGASDSESGGVSGSPRSRTSVRQMVYRTEAPQHPPRNPMVGTFPHDPVYSDGEG